jgi:tetratricopeptide (TPR) repeat protein
VTTPPSRTARPLLTAAMIVRDEQEHIGDCLASLDGVVDEIVVVDTGSTDDTVAIARAHGATVYTETWHDDFSQARNQALDRAHGEWILYIDADERLQPMERNTVDDLLVSTDHVAYRVLLRPFVGATQCREYRLWRNDPRIRFEGVIHEKVVPSIKAVAAADARHIGLCDLAVDHLGYDGDQTTKHLRNLPLLEAQLRTEPGNVFNWRHFARVLFAVGRSDDGKAALEHAVDAIRAASPPPPVGALVYADLIERRRGTAEAEALIDEAMATYPRDPVLIWVKAAIDLDDGDPESALHLLDGLLRTDLATLDDTMSYDRRLFGAWPHDARGLCLFRLGRFDEAAAAYRAAELDDPDSREYRAKRLLSEHHARADSASSLWWSKTVDVGDVAVLFAAHDAPHAEAIEAAVALLPAAGDTSAEAMVEFGASGDAEPVEWQHADGDVRARWYDDDVALFQHGSVRARVDDQSARINGDDDLRRAIRQLLPYLLTHLLATRHRFVLHGGAIVRDGQAVLVLGPTGSGKSTLTVSAAEAGWAVLSDDLVAVRLAGDQVEARGIAKPLLVPGALAERLGLDAHPAERDLRERWVVTGVEADDRWYPVAASIVSERSDENDAGAQVLSSQQLFEWLLFSFLAGRDEKRLRLYLPVAAALTRRGGGLVRHGPHVTSHGTLIDALLRELGDRSET